MEVFTSKHEKIVLANDAFSSGGEGEVRKVLSAPSRLSNACVKIYYQKKRTTEQERKIKYMVANPPTKIEGNGFLIGWPIDYVTDAGGRFLGFAMRLAFPNSQPLIILTATKLRKDLESAWHLRFDRNNGKSALVARMKLICNIAIPIHILHSTGKYVLRDFKPANLLITYDGRVTIVDMDSVQISEGNQVLYANANTAVTPDYMPPEYYTKGIGKDRTTPLNKSWDHFAIGVVFYQILFGLHPYVVTPWKQADADCNEIFQSISKNLFPFGPNGNEIKTYPPLHDKFKILPKQLQDLFLRTFSESFANRPSADEWGKCIRALVNKTGPVTMPTTPLPQQTPKPIPHPPKAPSTTAPTPKTPSTPTSSPKPHSHLKTIVCIIISIILLIVILFSIHDFLVNKLHLRNVAPFILGCNWLYKTIRDIIKGD